MRITNVTVGYLFWIIITILLFCPLYFFYEEINEGDSFIIAVFSIISGALAMISMIVLGISIVDDLITGEIEIDFTINTPLNAIKRYYETKKVKEEALTELYQKIAREENTERLDLLIEKVKILQQ